MKIERRVHPCCDCCQLPKAEDVRHWSQPPALPIRLLERIESNPLFVIAYANLSQSHS
ncbi:hypothetical protein [Shewanella litorisediminis]|uniref:Uncharacterized protein n=1 Tax=Shewanella litorisediminis TaxID=1173586 RepID=A0ABX7G477_9GAMM|nr:hypothetical protein [Shewanella litorisediminis]MCL2919957.1 hypothetical protein [Shewanella litorisediminis]QRH02132.1 hypothetical protein JQC75_01485 [Shewanella litorisediminis]